MGNEEGVGGGGGRGEVVRVLGANVKARSSDARNTGRTNCPPKNATCCFLVISALYSTNLQHDLQNCTKEKQQALLLLLLSMVVKSTPDKHDAAAAVHTCPITGACTGPVVVPCESTAVSEARRRR